MATALSQLVGGVVPLAYFGRENSSLLRLGKYRFDGYSLRKTCFNGASELMSNISMSLVRATAFKRWQGNDRIEPWK